MLTIRRSMFPAAAVAAIILSGCGGGGGGDSTSPPPGPTLTANYSSIQSIVFTPTCATSGCHLGANPPEGLLLDSSNSYALLVDVASVQEPLIKRVAPNQPDNS